MSCPTAPLSLKDRLDAMEGPVELPGSFYIMTLLMILTVTGIPLLYRWLWLVCYDFIADVRKDLSPGDAPAGCRRVGKDGIRNLSTEEFDTESYQEYPRHSTFPKLTSEDDDDDDDDKENVIPEKDVQGRIEALFLHPIKSTAPIEVQSAQVTATGLEHDRIYSFAQLTSSLPDSEGKVNHSWVFITQRAHPRLALVRTELWVPDEDAADYDEESEWVRNGGCLVVRFPFTPDFDIFSRNGLKALTVIWLTRWKQRSMSAEPMINFKLPLNPSKERVKEKGYMAEEMKIWRESPEAWNIQGELPEETWGQLKFHLGVSNPLTLFRVQSGHERKLFKCAPGADKVEYQPLVGFQDSYPIHIQNISSVNAIESEVQQSDKSYAADSRRFRANVYISGPKAFVEHGLLRMAVQGAPSAGPAEPVLFALPSRTPRCTLPNVDPSIGVKNRANQPLKQLNSHLVIDSGTQSPILGMHAVPMGDAIGQTVNVKDEVLLYRAGKHVYNKDPSEEAWTEIW